MSDYKTKTLDDGSVIFGYNPFSMFDKQKRESPPFRTEAELDKLNKEKKNDE